MGFFSSLGKLLDYSVSFTGGAITALLADSQCSTCGEVFFNRQDAERHVRQEHLNR